MVQQTNGNQELYIVWEDNYGDVSYWTTYDGALKEAFRIVKDMYDKFEDPNDALDDIVGIRTVYLNKRW